jgi:hypothetical protein
MVGHENRGAPCSLPRAHAYIRGSSRRGIPNCSSSMNCPFCCFWHFLVYNICKAADRLPARAASIGYCLLGIRKSMSKLRFPHEPCSWPPRSPWVVANTGAKGQIWVESPSCLSGVHPAKRLEFRCADFACTNVYGKVYTVLI